MAGAPKRGEVQRVTIEIRGGPKKEDWKKFKAAVKETLEGKEKKGKDKGKRRYKSVKARIVEIAYVRKRYDRS